MSTIGAVPPKPALFTTTSNPPNSETAESNIRCTWASTVTSQGTDDTPNVDADSASRRSC